MTSPGNKYTIKLNEQQAKEFTHLGMSYTSSYVKVIRAKILLLAHQHLDWSNRRIAGQVGCSVDTVKNWCKRWHVQKGCRLDDNPRSGAPRRFSPVVRAQIVALACSKPENHGKMWKQWSGENLAQVAVVKKIVESISPGTVRKWLHQYKIKPWQYHCWQKPTDPKFVQKATPVLEFYERAEELAKQGEAVFCVDEKASIQARQRVQETRAAIAGHPMQVAHRYKRMGGSSIALCLYRCNGSHFCTLFHIVYKKAEDLAKILTGFRRSIKKRS